MEFRIEPAEEDKTWLRLYDGSRKAAELQVIDYEMYIAGVLVPMAGIAEVHTEAAYRRQGWMRTLFGHLEAYLRERGYPVSLLFGIPDFYHRFGYATALVNSVVRIPTRQAELARGRLAARAITEPDIPLLQALYEQDCRGRSGALARQPAAWSRMLRGWAARSRHGCRTIPMACCACETCKPCSTRSRLLWEPGLLLGVARQPSGLWPAHQRVSPL